MTSKAARREYLQAVGEFERACRHFSTVMQEILAPPAGEGDATMQFIVSELGERKPAARAPSAVVVPKKRQEG